MKTLIASALTLLAPIAHAACDGTQAFQDVKTEITQTLPFALSNFQVARVQLPPGSKIVVPNDFISFEADSSTWIGGYNVDAKTCKGTLLIVMRAEPK